MARRFSTLLPQVMTNNKLDSAIKAEAPEKDILPVLTKRQFTIIGQMMNVP